MRYYYKDQPGSEGKVHYTQAPFAGWEGPAGLLNTYYAMFVRPKGGVLLVPWYLLTKETQALLPPRPDASERTSLSS